MEQQMLWLCGPEPVVPSATQVADVHSQPEESPDVKVPAVTRATRRKRDLTAQERVFLKERKAQKWIVHCQVTPPGYQGPKRAISYLARYVAGVAISDRRLVRDANGFIVISYRDYKNRKQTGKKYGELCLSIAEFMLRFMLHILPRNMARVRHAGLFAASGREARLTKCRQLILVAKQGPAVIESSGATPTAESLSAQPQEVVTVQAAAHDQKANDPASGDRATNEQPQTEEHAATCTNEAEEPKARTCECRYCKGEAVEIGRLKGKQTNRIIEMAQIVASELDTHLPEVNPSTVSDLLAAIRMSWFTLCMLPATIAALLGGQRLTRIEASALEARLLHELRLSPCAAELGLVHEPAPDKSAPTSGVPPPLESEVVAST